MQRLNPALQIWRAAGVLQGPSQNHMQKKRGLGLELRELPNIWRFPFNIYTMAKASDFKFGIQLGSAKAHHKITPIGKSGCDLGLGSSQKYW